jgi:hypothetical protein
MDVPPSVGRGARLPLTVRLRSMVAQPATPDVFDGALLAQRLQVALPKGDQQISISLPRLGPGFHSLRVVLRSTSDTVAENDEGDAFARVRGIPRVLVAEDLPGEGNVVAGALRAKGMSVRQESATLIEPSTADLSTFDAVVLVDVPVLDLDFALLDPTHSPLVSYVNGGGLVVIGGPASYGLGDYTHAALDDVLPVSMRPARRAILVG